MDSPSLGYVDGTAYLQKLYLGLCAMKLSSAESPVPATSPSKPRDEVDTRVFLVITIR